MRQKTIEERYLAHRIVYRGREYPLSIVIIRRFTDGSTDVKIEKFTAEIHSTSFYSGTIIVEEPGSCLIFA